MPHRLLSKPALTQDHGAEVGPCIGEHFGDERVIILADRMCKVTWVRGERQRVMRVEGGWDAGIKP